MIGNDIVDLEEAKLKSNWQRPRFLEKLFTSKEQQLIRAADNSFLMVWRLWSMKEAAYKLYTQLNPSRFYNPKSFKCEINDSKGKACYQDFICEVETRITSQYIICEAYLTTNDVISECVEINLCSPKAQSETIKDLLLLAISNQFNMLKDDLKIKKSDFGIPSVYRNTEKLNIGISISHHGNYGAFAISQL